MWSSLYRLCLIGKEIDGALVGVGELDTKCFEHNLIDGVAKSGSRGVP